MCAFGLCLHFLLKENGAKAAHKMLFKSAADSQFFFCKKQSLNVEKKALKVPVFEVFGLT